MKKKLSIIAFAHLINKNTAEFTQLDQLEYLRWLSNKKAWKQIVPPVLISAKPKDGKVILTWRK